MLKAIEIKSVKGQTVTQPLTGRDLFIGRNGSGKTTRIQALGLAMLGYVPGNGKTANDTFKLATGDEMCVGLVTDEFRFVRTFKRNEKINKATGETKTSIKESLTVSPSRGERTETQKKERITAEIGNFPVMMDFNDFLSLSDAKRRDFIYSLSPITSDTWNRERVQNYLESKLLRVEIQENNPEQYNALQEVIREAMQQFPMDFGVHEGLQSMLDWTATQLSFWNSKKKDAQGAVRQMAEMKNELTETDRNIATQKKELEELQQQLIDVEKKISADEEKKKSIDARLKRIQEIGKLIANLTNAPVLTDTADVDQKIAQLQQQLVEENDPAEQLDTLNRKAQEAKKSYNQLEKKAQQLKEQIIHLNAGVKTLVGSAETISGLGGSCVIDKRIGCTKDFTPFMQFVAQKKQEATEMVAKVQAELDGIEKQMAEMESEGLAAQEERDALQKRANEIVQSNNRIQKQIIELEKEREKHITEKERREHQIKMYEEERSKLMNHPAEPIGDIIIMRAQAGGIRSRIDELKISIQEKEKAKQALLLLQQSLLDNRKADYKASALKLLQESLGAKGIQGELVKEILEPIRNMIAENLQLMGFDFEPFFQTESETGKEIFQFGWVNEKGHFVNFDAMSTGQQTVFLAAMMMTIIDRAKPKLRLLVMDNLNHLDRTNFQLLINGLNKLAHKVDNIILAGAIEFPFEAEGWNVCDVTPGKEESLHE